MTWILIFGLFLQGRPLTIPTRTGATHAVIMWFDLDGTPHKSKTTNAVNAALALPGAGAPPRPAGFAGNDAQWNAVWEAKPTRAFVVGGRPSVNTPSGDYEDGTIKVLPDGVIYVYAGDQDLVPPIVLRPGEYNGMPPNITSKANKCGLAVAGGNLTGTRVRACNGHKPL